MGSAAYLSLLVTIFDAQSVHGPDDGCQWLDGVAIDNRLILFHVFSGEAIFVDDPREKAHRPHLMSALFSLGTKSPRPVKPLGSTCWLSWPRAGSDLDAEFLSWRKTLPELLKIQQENRIVVRRNAVFFHSLDTVREMASARSWFLKCHSTAFFFPLNWCTSTS